MGDFYSFLRNQVIPSLLVAPFILSPLMAMKKRYAPWFWMFACGPIGLVVITCLPSLKSAKDPEEFERFENRANLIGAVLSCIGLFIGMIPVVLALANLQSRSIGI